LNALDPVPQAARGTQARDAGWAHDLRNRLTHALLGLERLRREHGGPAGAASLDEIAVNLQLARSACNDRLSAAGPDGNTSTRHRRVSPQPLRNVILRAVQAATEIANTHADCAVRVLVRCPASLTVSVDTTLLHRAIENLTLNALQASPTGNEVRVEAQGVGDRMCITLADDGCGMGKAELDAFRTPGRSGRSAQGGTGYGTASLFDCLGQMNAELELETERGVGTTASIHWPEPGLTASPREVSWCPWQQVAGIDALHASRPEAGSTVRVPRGAHGSNVSDFLALCAQRGLTVESRSCLASTRSNNAPANDTLAGPRRATWATRRATPVSPAS